MCTFTIIGGYHRFIQYPQSALSVRSFAVRSSTALCEIFEAHPEKRAAFTMACRMRQQFYPPASSLLYILSNETTHKGYDAIGNFEARMKEFESRLQAECVLGTRVFRERRYTDHFEDGNLQKIADQMVLNCLPVGGTLTSLLPSYKQILQKARSNQSVDESEIDEDFPMTTTRAGMAGKILGLLILADECLAEMDDDEISNALGFLQAPVAEEEREDAELQIKLAAKAIQALIDSDDCLSKLTKREKRTVITLLLRKYRGEL